MMREPPLERARRACAAGRYRRALSIGWKAIHRALPREDRKTVEEVHAIADAIAQRTEGATAAKAEQLRVYCRACLDTATGQLSTPSEVVQLLQRGRNLRGRD